MVGAEAFTEVPRKRSWACCAGDHGLVRVFTPMPEQDSARLHVAGPLDLLNEEASSACRKPYAHALSLIADFTGGVNRQANVGEQWCDWITCIIAQSYMKDVPI